MEDPNRTAKLTEREKDSLRRWLEHKTAKEIAIDLGISHHAVEKRLKMARTKLGVGSSLEAARLLADEERSGQTVPQPADLQTGTEPRKAWPPRPFAFGVIAMLLLTVFVFALAPAQHPPINAVTPAETNLIELDHNSQRIFDRLDENESGFLEEPESPFVTLAFLDPEASFKNEEEMTGEAILGDPDDADQIAEFYATADTDDDGRVSFREYYVWSEAHLAELGIEISSVLRVVPAPES